MAANQIAACQLNGWDTSYIVPILQTFQHFKLEFKWWFALGKVMECVKLRWNASIHVCAKQTQHTCEDAMHSSFSTSMGDPALQAQTAFKPCLKYWHWKAAFCAAFSHPQNKTGPQYQQLFVSLFQVWVTYSTSLSGGSRLADFTSKVVMPILRCPHIWPSIYSHRSYI